MGLSYESMLYMFQCCGLAMPQKDSNEWSFLSQKFTTFWNMYLVYDETDLMSSKILISNNNNMEKQKHKAWYFIYLGEEDLKSIIFACHHHPERPHNNGIESYRLDFHKTLEAWTFTSENCCKWSNPSLLLNRIQIYLLPLILSQLHESSQQLFAIQLYYA